MTNQLIHSEYLIEEMTTDGHSPLKFLCNNGQVYFCKYRATMDRQEINCLAYEFVCSTLLNIVGIPTPETNIVVVGEGSLDPNIIRRNRRIRVGYSCFGSKLVENSLVLNDFVVLDSKKDFNNLLNPFDVIRIAIFDLWVDNMDRGRKIDEGHNYNLLLQQVGKKQKIIAFDHGFTFGGIDRIGIFNPNIPLIEDNKFHESAYYKNVVNYIPRNIFLEIVDSFINLLSQDYEEVVKNCIESLPQEWDLTPNLDRRVVQFLSSTERINEIRQIIIK
jgi:hypothetical protein